MGQQHSPGTAPAKDAKPGPSPQPLHNNGATRSTIAPASAKVEGVVKPGPPIATTRRYSGLRPIGLLKTASHPVTASTLSSASSSAPNTPPRMLLKRRFARDAEGRRLPPAPPDVGADHGAPRWRLLPRSFSVLSTTPPTTARRHGDDNSSLSSSASGPGTDSEADGGASSTDEASTPTARRVSGRLRKIRHSFSRRRPAPDGEDAAAGSGESDGVSPFHAGPSVSLFGGGWPSAGALDAGLPVPLGAGVGVGVDAGAVTDVDAGVGAVAVSPPSPPPLGELERDGERGSESEDEAPPPDSVIVAISGPWCLGPPDDTSLHRALHGRKLRQRLQAAMENDVGPAAVDAMCARLGDIAHVLRFTLTHTTTIEHEDDGWVVCSTCAISSKRTEPIKPAETASALKRLNLTRGMFPDFKTLDEALLHSWVKVVVDCDGELHVHVPQWFKLRLASVPGFHDLIAMFQRPLEKALSNLGFVSVGLELGPAVGKDSADEPASPDRDSTYDVFGLRFFG